MPENSITKQWLECPTEELILGMSNFDHSIDDGLEEALRANPNVAAHYSGWNFSAYVWVIPDEDQFTCQVWQYHQPVKELKAATLQEIMDRVSDEFGAE